MKNRETKGNSTSRTRITRENAQNIFWLSFECIVLSTICFEMEESDVEKVDIESSRHSLFLILFYYFWVSRYALSCSDLPFFLDFLSCGRVCITLNNDANWGKSCQSSKSSSFATAELTNRDAVRPFIAVLWGFLRHLKPIFLDFDYDLTTFDES